MEISMNWHDAHRELDMTSASGSRMLAPTARTIEIELSGVRKEVQFASRPLSVSFRTGPAVASEDGEGNNSMRD
jgi:hypothetical protein